MIDFRLAYAHHGHEIVLNIKGALNPNFLNLTINRETILL